MSDKQVKTVQEDDFASVELSLLIRDFNIKNNIGVDRRRRLSTRLDQRNTQEQEEKKKAHILTEAEGLNTLNLLDGQVQEGRNPE